MRGIVIGALSLAEAAVLAGIVMASLELSQDLQRNETVGCVTHAVVASTRRIAFRMRSELRRLV